jgi:hypothetical protein
MIRATLPYGSSAVPETAAQTFLAGLVLSFCIAGTAGADGYGISVNPENAVESLSRSGIPKLFEGKRRNREIALGLYSIGHHESLRSIHLTRRA